MTNRRYLGALLAALLAAQTAAAAGLGGLRVLSQPGEPLRARVELLLAPKDRPGKIRAGVVATAPGADVPEDGGELPLSAAVLSYPGGKVALLIRTEDPPPIERFDLVVAVESPAGRAWRRFPVQLAPRAPSPAAPGAEAATKPEAAPGPEAPAPAAAAALAPLAAPAGASHDSIVRQLRSIVEGEEPAPGAAAPSSAAGEDAAWWEGNALLAVALLGAAAGLAGLALRLRR